MNAAAPGRPAVSVVMPFAGDAGAADHALAALCAIARAPGDELILADNTPDQVAGTIADRWPEVHVVAAHQRRSSYSARNVGAASARGDWLLFIDSDCWPEPHLLDRYFTPAPAPNEGALAGQVIGDPSQKTLFARYQLGRGHLELDSNRRAATRPSAVTANLLVRTQAWRSVGGFAEEVRSGGDRDLTWRLQDAGWSLGYRPEAGVRHRHRDTLLGLARQTIRYGAGRTWLDYRHPATRGPRAADGSAFRALGASARFALRGQPEDAAFRVVDALVIALDRLGSWLGNGTPRPPAACPSTQVAVMADRFPSLSETFIATELSALRRAGLPARVEAAGRPGRQDLRAACEHQIEYREDDGRSYRAMTLLWLVARHPRRSRADVVAQRRWRAEEMVPPLRALAPVAWRVARRGDRHLHAHFADGAALTALRVARLTARPYSVTAHAYEIFKEPRNLREKLEEARFITSGCQYNLTHLRQIAPRASGHVMVMGVDVERVRRRAPQPGGRGLVAVGRLVEKKGFAHLIDALARLQPDAPIDGLEVVGDGPLADQLCAQVRRLGLQGVRFLGALPHAETLAAIERAELLVMPCVVAADGDRDSMPVVVKEALALEVPVVASNLVGLPEVIRPEWGRLVPPGDPVALAGAIEDLLALSPADRAAMGRAGRAYVVEHCNVDREARGLVELITGGRTAPVSGRSRRYAAQPPDAGPRDLRSRSHA